LLNWGIAISLGIVEGFTEFIPVSSTGHLILAGQFLGFTGAAASSFEVAIQLGAVLSVVVLYRERFMKLIPGAVDPYPSKASALDGWSGLWNIGIATLPALVVGFLGRHIIKDYLFSPVTVTWALAVGGMAILIAEKFASERRRSSLDGLTWKQAFGVGMFQVLALWPGTSRSAATIVGGMLLGLDRKAAAEFSFLIAVPIMFAATGYEVLKMGNLLSAQQTGLFLVGFAVSFVVALLSIATFIRLLNRWTLVPFAWYRILIAGVFYFLIGTVAH
jgi:undecaprenyl-diphosphatase